MIDSINRVDCLTLARLLIEHTLLQSVPVRAKKGTPRKSMQSRLKSAFTQAEEAHSTNVEDS